MPWPPPQPTELGRVCAVACVVTRVLIWHHHFYQVQAAQEKLKGGSKAAAARPAAATEGEAAAAAGAQDAADAAGASPTVCSPARPCGVLVSQVTHMHPHSYMHTGKHACTHLNARARARAHTHTHTHTHTHKVWHSAKKSRDARTPCVVMAHVRTPLPLAWRYCQGERGPNTSSRGVTCV